MNSPLDGLNTKTYRILLNSFSGLVLCMAKPFKKGDFIQIDGKLGSVENIVLRKTLLKSPEGDLSFVENSKFHLKTLHNLSSKKIIRIDL